MSNQATPDPKPYGKQFADAWILLQRFLGDLDAKELDQLSQMNAEQTLALLKQQPALGSSYALPEGLGKSPEALAVSILQERLNVLLQSFATSPKTPFGGRFLQRWRELGGPISCFSYSQIQKIKVADQLQFQKLFKSRPMGISFHLTQRIKKDEPEELAQALLLQHRMGTLLMSSILF